MLSSHHLEQSCLYTFVNLFFQICQGNLQCGFLIASINIQFYQFRGQKGWDYKLNWVVEVSRSTSATNGADLHNQEEEGVTFHGQHQDIFCSGLSSS